jgi:hypothetical protein
LLNKHEFLSAVGFRLNRYHHNYLYWIYPVIFLGLAIYAYRKDRQDRNSAITHESATASDTSGVPTRPSENIYDLQIVSPDDSAGQVMPEP